MPHQDGPPPRPTATYRLQFSKDFRFDDARRLVPYLAALGISHVYASPLLMARAGSMHGYDIVDHNRLNPEVGEGTDFDALVDDLHCHGMGLILDFVPNHMGIGPDNPWWVDVLEWGPASAYAGYFDIDWHPLEPTLAGKILLPVLGNHYGAALERGDVQVRLNAPEGAFAVTYRDHPFPIAPADYPALLHAAGRHADETARRFDPIIADLRACLKGNRRGRGALARRQQVADLKRRLADVVGQDRRVKQCVEDALGDLNGRPGDPGSFDDLHRLLERQSYRLAYWRVAAHAINYRRFFDINDLIGLRMERADLFEASHELIGRLIAAGKIQGLRLDHIDGLRDPKGYFDRLQRLAVASGATTGQSGSPPSARHQRRRQPFYVVVEKILAPHERLRDDWAVSGTTGYEFMADVNGLFIDPAAGPTLTRVYERLAGGAFDFDEMVVDARHQVMHEILGSELNVLANAFNRLAKQSRSSSDFSVMGFREALANIVAHFPVYRTYVADGTVNDDRRDIDWAIGKARRAARTPDPSIYDFIHGVLTLALPRDGRPYRRRDIIDAALKFQQYTGPVMAKAMEDTVFYRYVPLVSLNEVGGAPGHGGTTPAAFHEANRQRLRTHPFSLVATATHDHKRGEDVRARINVLSEMPREWSRRVQRWMQLNQRKRGTVDGRPAPRRNDEYLFYQTVVGAWPPTLAASDAEGLRVFSDRLNAYMRKALREAKLRTSWAAPNDGYEAAVAEFVTRSLDPRQSRPFVENIAAFVDSIAATGAVNGLAQVLLKLVSPGVPDFYQGTELWDFSLVDPDNRRPVDYGLRQKHLRALDAAAPGELLQSWRDGRVKQYMIHRVLAIRRHQPALFAAGDYRVLEVAGPHAGRLVVVARTHGQQALIAVIPRLTWPLMRDQPVPLPRRWGATGLSLPADAGHNRAFVDVMSGMDVAVPADDTIDVSRLLSEFPVALLVTRPDADAAIANPGPLAAIVRDPGGRGR